MLDIEKILKLLKEYLNSPFNSHNFLKSLVHMIKFGEDKFDIPTFKKETCKWKRKRYSSLSYTVACNNWEMCKLYYYKYCFFCGKEIKEIPKK